MKYILREYKFKEIGYWMDGGTISIVFTNESGNELTIDLQQRIIPDYHEEISKIPGRIYLNGNIVDKRSVDEHLVLEHLELNILDQLEPTDSQALLEEINWIKSSKYMEFEPQRVILSEKRKKYLLAENKLPKE